MSFQEKLIKKLKEQIHAKRVGFLLGAGSSHLDGAGYPLAPHLWEKLKTILPIEDQEAIDKEMAKGRAGLEDALDRLDDGTARENGLRHRVAAAIAQYFQTISPPISQHQVFIQGLSRRSERRVSIFNLNYDPLVERAADEEGLLLIDGFSGINQTFFCPQTFEYRLGLPGLRRGKACIDPLRGIINQYKLHGSVGWFADPAGQIRRGRPGDPVLNGARLLLIPPHHRKAQDTGVQPYAAIWSDFRGLMTNDKVRLLSRLVCVGYGMRDTHVNPVVEAACTRSNFTLIILARSLRDPEFDQWKHRKNVIIVTETRSSLYGEEGPRIPEIWSFEWLVKELNNA